MACVDRLAVAFCLVDDEFGTDCIEDGLLAQDAKWPVQTLEFDAIGPVQTGFGDDFLFVLGLC